MSLPTPPAKDAAPKKRSLFQRIFTRKLLFASILIHLILGIGASYYIVEHHRERGKPSFTAQGGQAAANTRALEHKVSMAKMQKTMSAPAPAKRIAVAGLTSLSLPEIPMTAVTPDAAPKQMAGIGQMGSGFGPGSGFGGGGGGGGSGGGGIPMFGFRENHGGGSLAGYLYDLKQTSDHKPTQMSPERYGVELQKFFAAGWDQKMMDAYYKSPKPLYITQVFIPDMIADEAPKAFGVDKGPHKVEPRMWAAWYKGKVTAPFTGSFRFVGFADDVLEVRFAGKHVLSAGCHPVGGVASDGKYVYDFLESQRQGWYASMGDRVGSSISVEQGKSYDIDILIGEEPGGFFNAHLLWERGQGRKSGNPKLPIFQLLAGRPTKTRFLPPFETGGSGALVWGQDSGGTHSLLDALKPTSM